MWCKKRNEKEQTGHTRGVTRVRIPVQLLVFSQARMDPWARAKARTGPSIQSILKQMCCPIYPLNLIMGDINNWSEGLDPDSSAEVGSSHVAVVAKYTMWIFGFSGSLGRINPKRQQGQGLLWFQGNNIKHMQTDTLIIMVYVYYKNRRHFLITNSLSLSAGDIQFSLKGTLCHK